MNTAVKSKLTQKIVTAAAVGLTVASNANAQLAKVTSVMDNVSDVMTGVGVVIFTIAIMFAGFKMAFQHAKWSEISNIVIGGILVGGASAIAGWLIN